MKIPLIFSAPAADLSHAEAPEGAWTPEDFRDLRIGEY